MSTTHDEVVYLQILCAVMGEGSQVKIQDMKHILTKYSDMTNFLLLIPIGMAPSVSCPIKSKRKKLFKKAEQKAFHVTIS